MMDLTDSEKTLIEAARRAREMRAAWNKNDPSYTYSAQWAVDKRDSIRSSEYARDILEAIIAGSEVA
jgi:hypothetical protein